MLIYEYVCRACRTHQDVFRCVSDRNRPPICPQCGQAMCRSFQCQLAPVMQEHWSTALGKPVSDRRRFLAELRKSSDLASERLGFEQNYQPVDIDDRKALGVTDEGLPQSV